ncbi:SRPBCC family protein [Cupriavidus basilensis]|uniref:SRPBCC family protein n=1 Tax=Cupriavidus basilensis TaxID=68895 RepID=UPI00157AE8EB|nr:SRPBCC family protein [Cupriavidus basilensis]NUA31335.1 carbon monoxide dehydrogenase [Cupriavidus basilensis]
MKVALEKVFPLAATGNAAWLSLQDIEAVAACMPGARITERVDDTHYKGTITVRLGPATMSFKGDIEVLGLDPQARSLHLAGKGSDSTGQSAASMDLLATVRATGATCELAGKSEVSMSGKAAAFGGRMMNTVADQILKQFADNFAALVQARQAPPMAVPPGAHAPEVPPAVPAPQAELNGLALAWAVVRDWLRGIFSRKAT